MAMAGNLIHEVIPVGMLQCNCSILGDPATREAVVVDPGDEVERILQIIQRHGLKVRSKDEVIAAAADFGLPFTEPEFDSLIWNLEAHLAARRGEKFDAQFPLWQTMWGKYYLEYLVVDLIPALGQADFDAVMKPAPQPQAVHQS